MKNLIELSNKIRRAIPRLMEVNTGCVVVSERTGRFIEIGRECFDISSDGVIIDEQAPSSASNKYQNVQEVIGHNPQLTDVLEYLCMIGDNRVDAPNINFYINGYGNIWAHFYKTGIDKVLCSWDLSKPFLRDQNELTINAINNVESLKTVL